MVVSVDNSYALFDRFDPLRRDQAVQFVAAMFAATITGSDADPETMAELSIYNLLTMKRHGGPIAND